MTTYGNPRHTGFDPFSSFTREMSTTAGLLCLYGMVNLIPGTWDLIRSTTDDQDWSGDADTYPPVVLQLAALFQVMFSIASIALGFQWLVSGGGSRVWSMISMVLASLSLFTFVVGFTFIAFSAAKENYPFISSEYDPSTKENRSVASLLTLGYMAYNANNFCALVYLNCKMFMFQSEKWVRYHRAFYKMLYMLFGFFTLLAGATHLALGVYIYEKVDTERLSSAVDFLLLSGPYYIIYSEVAMVVACFQCLLGFYMLYRAMQSPVGHHAQCPKIFQGFAWFVLLVTICAQVFTQLAMNSHSPYDNAAEAGYGAQAVALVVGLGLFPLYLDATYYTTPETVEQNHFSCIVPWKKDEAIHEERKTEGQVKAAETGV